MRIAITTVFFVGTLLALFAPAWAVDALTIRITPLVGRAPCDLRIEAYVQPSPDNRTLVVVVDSEDYYRASEVQLEGDHAARRQQLIFRGLPPGDYEVLVSVERSTGDGPRQRRSVQLYGN